MVADIDENFPDEMDSNGEVDESENNNLKGTSLAEKKAQEQAQKNLLARKRIDELMEKKRLKELLDDSDDW
ncbi:PA3496 family putative envelope integrity protein [Colwelliaceae bacterium MEBiC 14330]